MFRASRIRSPLGDENPLMHFQIEIEREEDGRWIAEVPDLPRVMVYGKDRASAAAKVQALAFRVLAGRLEHGEAVPASPDPLV